MMKCQLHANAPHCSTWDTVHMVTFQDLTAWLVKGKCTSSVLEDQTATYLNKIGPFPWQKECTCTFSCVHAICHNLPNTRIRKVRSLQSKRCLNNTAFTHGQPISKTNAA